MSELSELGNRMMKVIAECKDKTEPDLIMLSGFMWVFDLTMKDFTLVDIEKKEN